VSPQGIDIFAVVASVMTNMVVVGGGGGGDLIAGEPVCDWAGSGEGSGKGRGGTGDGTGIGGSENWGERRGSWRVYGRVSLEIGERTVCGLNPKIAGISRHAKIVILVSRVIAHTVRSIHSPEAQLI
jgi:hypothetical protein